MTTYKEFLIQFGFSSRHYGLYVHSEFEPIFLLRSIELVLSETFCNLRPNWRDYETESCVSSKSFSVLRGQQGIWSV